MGKSYGAHIYCSAPGCSAQPYPPAGVRETFSLTKVGDNWFCEEHVPPKERASRIVAATPFEALAAFEAVLTAQDARLTDAIDGDGHVAVRALEAFQQEVRRALAELRKALTPQKPPASPDDTPKSRRAPKKIKANERRGNGQVDWVAETAVAEPASES